MKFPRNARILRSQLDAAPVAAVFFVLVLFVMMGPFIYKPGVRLNLELPPGEGLSGTDKPTVSVAIDADGRLYYENQRVEENALQGRLREAAAKCPEPLTLVVQADKSVSYDRLMRLTVLARNSGISEAWLATLPGPLGNSRQ
jgi:biopolymer transport protein ExbD